MKRRFLKRIGFLALSVALWTVPAVISATHGYYSQTDGQSLSWTAIFLKTWPYNLAWAFFTPLVIWLGMKFPLFSKHIWKQLIIHIALSFATAVVYIAVISLYHSVLEGFSGGISQYLDFLTLGLSFYLDMDILFYWAILATSQIVLFARNRVNTEKQISSEEMRTDSFLNRITVKDGRTIHIVETKDIVSIEAANYYIYIHTKEKSLLHRERMKNIEVRLHPKRFLRVHKSVIINLAYLKEIIRRENGEYSVVMENDQIFNVSRRRKGSLLSISNYQVSSTAAGPAPS